MIVVCTSIHVAPDRRVEVIDCITDLVERSRNEEGTVRYYAQAGLTDPNVSRFFEQYENAAAAEVYTESEQYRRFVELLPAVTDEEIETVQFAADDVEAVSFGAEEAVAAVE